MKKWLYYIKYISIDEKSLELNEKIWEEKQKIV